ncbi:MAG: BamA/TamA family outer membrane protein [Chitinophagaceae bacterium]
MQILALGQPSPIPSSVNLRPSLNSNSLRGDSSFVIIRHILITGNRKTKDAIILRDLNLEQGDTLYLRNAREVLEDRRQQLLNTSLFLTVNLFLKNWGGQYIDISVEVIERWYTFAFPIFSLADRNFNVWWVEEHHALDRVNYGISGYQNNLTGKNDRLTLTLQSGYTQRYAISYQVPYINKNLRSGLGFMMGYNQNREVNFATVRNKLSFFKEDHFLFREFFAGVSYTYRKAIRFQNKVSLNYFALSVGDTILGLNPDFFLYQRTREHYLELNYQFSYTGADNWAYPLVGFNIEGAISRKGFGTRGGVNQTELDVQTAKYFQIFPYTYGAIGFRGKIQLPFHQPYFLQKGLGYGEDYLRGLEYYVINADAFGILKADLKQQLFSFRIRTFLLPKQFATIPIRVFAKVFGDLGYAHSQYPGTSLLNNQILYSEGLGLDLVSFYDIRIRLEYSFNQLGQKGLFLHTKSEF